MRKKQIFLYLGIFFTAVLAMLGIAFGIRQAIRAGNLAGIDWYNTYDKEFVITTEEELYDVATLSDYYDFAGQTIKLGADIVVNEGNAEDWLENAPSKKWQPITEFAGTFDGQGHSISGLYGKSSSMSMGLFSETKKGCVIKDFKLLNSFFSNSTNNGVGSIMGEGTGKIQKVYSDAIIYGEGESNGGIAGLIKEELTLKECWFDGKVIGEQRSNGGIIGWVDRKSDVKIDNCLNSGFIQFIGEGNSKTGGFIGGISDIAYRTDVSKVTITNSLTTGEIDVTNTTMSGAAIGTLRKLGALTCNNTYAVIEVTDNPASETLFGSSDGKLVGNFVPRFRENLIGVGGYQWTNLDFDKYWSCVEGATPILKCFAEDELNVANVEKKVDTSWYKEGQTEFTLMDAPDLWGFAMLSANTNFEGVTIKVGADITINDSDSSTWKEKAPEYNWFPIYSFSGTFDGQKHTISGLYVYSNGKRMSFFQQVNANGTIANFKLVNSYVRGSYCIGAVVAQGGGNISNIYTDAVVENTGEHTGGIIGALNQNGTISNCWFDGEVHGGTSYTGGITSASMAPMGVITHCLNTGEVYGGTTHSTGGITGIVNAGVTISDTLNAGKVDDSLSTNKNRTGSIIGRIFDSTETTQVTVHISSTYTTRESYETSIGQGYQTTGAPAVNTLAELKGKEGYRRTALNFEKYWAIDSDSHPTLQTFAEEIPTLPENVKRPVVADISWFDFDKDVFVIKTVGEFYGLTQLIGKNDFEGKTIKLGKDITFNTGNASSWGQGAPLNQWAPLHGFNGTFDGQGHTISGLYMNDGLWKVGLFGNVLEKAVIKNVKVTNSYFEGRYHVGAIAGMVDNVSVQGVYSDANIVVRKGHGGGLVGTLVNTKMDNAWFAGTVSGDCDYIGGITSFISLSDPEKNRGTTLSNCLNTGTITGKSNVGGIAGRVAAKATIKYSLNAGTVTGVKNAGSIVGVVVKDDNTICNIVEGVYATKESSKKAVGSGTAKGLTIVNTTADLTGVGGYQRTILDFDKYWSIVETSTPVLKKFGGTPVAIPNVARATAPDTSWYDAKKDTFVLTDYADIYGWAILSASNDFAGKTIKLGGNIVANSGKADDFKENVPLNQLQPVVDFAGTFDGQGYTISGLAANSENAWYVGIIGTAIPGATVKNIYVENSYIAGEYHIGSVVGHGTGVTIENVYSSAHMEAISGHLGGIIGTTSGVSSISNCWFDGKVIAEKSSYVGGITSFVADGNVTISHCLNTTPIKAKSNAAGIVGRVAAELTLTDCVNTAVINCMSAAGSVVGMITDDGKVTLDAVYGVIGTGGRVVGKGANQSGDSQIIHQLYISGRSGYVYTGLDYSKYWTALEGKAPQLSYFSDKITGEKVSLSGVERKDTSWYDADKKSYVLNDRADLFGFTYLLNSGNTFKGKTVTLGKNIKVNDGDAADWADGKEPLYQWMPIGSYEDHTSFAKAFQGTFDGKMHTISGLYTKNTGAANKMYNWCAGLFAKTGEGAVVKNVEVLNSYFESPYYNGIVGNATGTTIDTVYTDAIIVATGGNSGGIVGGSTESNINNVWFAGSLENKGQFTGGIVGVAGDKSTISNALTTGVLKTTTKSNNNYIGGIVGGANGKTLVTDSISVPKSITATKKYCIGSVIGGVNKDAKATATNTYALESTTTLTIGQQVKPEEIGPATNRIKACADLSGMNGYSLTKLDFVYYWVALANKTPELMSFSDGKALAVNTSFRADTKWYTEAKADVAGNAPGTEANPYVIYNKVELYGFAELVNEGITFKGQHVRLGADISVNSGDAASWADEAPDYAWIPIGSYVGHSDYSKSFAGTFDGQNPDTGEIYTISGLYTKKTGAANNMNNWCAGLFGRTAEGATVQNIKVENSYFEGITNNGVIGHATRTTIQNVYSDAIIVATSTQNGGIVGAVVGGTIDGAWFDGSVESVGQFVGGIAGLANTDATITNCLMTGSVKSTCTSANAYAGGLVGCASSNISLTNSLSAAKEVTAKGKRTGAALGSANAGTVKVTMDEVYVIAGIHNYAVGQNATGTYTEQPWVMQTLNGYNGYTLTKLDFTDKWIAVDGKTPELKVLSDATALDVVTNSFRPDTEFAGSGTETDPYIISTKAELYGLAQLVNEGTTFEGQYVELDSEIKVNALPEGKTVDYWAENAPAQAWNPIGKVNAFSGHFNGQGNAIIGLHYKKTDATVEYIGLFGKTTADSSVQNVYIKDSWFEYTGSKAGVYMGSAAGYGGGTFDTIYSDAVIKHNMYGAGGIVGATDMNLTISNCWYDGKLTVTRAGEAWSGGILGYTTAGVNRISHCLNSGEIHSDLKSGAARLGGIVGFINSKNPDMIIDDCLNTGKITTNGTVSQMATIAGMCNTGKITNSYATKESCGMDDLFAYGKDTLYQGSATATNVNMLEDLKGENGYLLTTLDFEEHWYAHKQSTPVLQCFTDVNDANVIDTNAWFKAHSGTVDDPYVLSSKIDLYSFAKKVNNGNPFQGQYVELGADIGVNALPEGKTIDYWATEPPTISWTPIGKVNAFAGHFNGQGNTISGLYYKKTDATVEYIGLFGKTTADSSVQNVNIETSWFEYTGSKAGVYMGSAAGYGGGIFDTIYSDAVIKHNMYGAGGIVGATDMNLTISNCWYDGKLTSTRAGEAWAGGILGYTTAGVNRISHCLNSGEIHSDLKTGAVRLGGIVGFINSKTPDMIIDDCLNTGKITTNGSISQMATIAGMCNTGKITNSYATKESCGMDALFDYGQQTLYQGTATATNVHMLEEKALYDTVAYTKLNNAFWTARVGNYPVPSVFTTTGNYENIATKNASYVIDTEWEGDGTLEKPYAISSAAELYGLALLSQANSYTGVIFELTDDITVNTQPIEPTDTDAVYYEWLPIGNGTYPFAGTLNGNGKVISGLHYKNTDAAATYGGLFGKTTSSNINQLSVKNSYFEYSGSAAGSYVGSVVGYAGGTIDTVYSDANVKHSQFGGGGIAGYTDTELHLSNCFFDGSLTLTRNLASNNRICSGGILGYANTANADVEMSHCLNNGEIINTGEGIQIGGLVGCVEKGTVRVTDCLNTGEVNGNGITNQVTALCGSGFNTSGKLYLDKSYATYESLTEIQQFDDTKLEHLYQNSKSGFVENIKMLSTNGVSGYDDIKGQNAYLNTLLDFEHYWTAVDGSTPMLTAFVTDETQVDVSTLDRVAGVSTMWSKVATGTEEDPYVLKDAADLYGLASLVNAKNGNNFAGKYIVLANDIVINASDRDTWSQSEPMNKWTPIGTSGTQFAGQIDGKGYAIRGVYQAKSANSGAYMGLFQYTAAGCVIENLSIENSMYTFTGSDDKARMGSFVAWANGGTFRNLYSDTLLNNNNRFTGGIIGLTNGEVTISGCWFNGEIQATGSTNYQGVGGILGWAAGGPVTIEHCLNSGEIHVNISTSHAGVGGLLGIAGSTFNTTGSTEGPNVTMDDCLNVGKVTTAGVISRLGTLIGSVVSRQVSITNSFATKESCGMPTLAAFTDDQPLYQGSVQLESKENVQRLDSESDANTKMNTAFWTQRDNTYPLPTVFITNGQ